MTDETRRELKALNDRIAQLAHFIDVLQRQALQHDRQIAVLRVQLGGR